MAAVTDQKASLPFWQLLMQQFYLSGKLQVSLREASNTGMAELCNVNSLPSDQ